MLAKLPKEEEQAAKLLLNTLSNKEQREFIRKIHEVSQGRLSHSAVD